MFKDPLGNEINVGDTVIYPTTRSQSPVIVKAVVASIKDNSYYRQNHYAKPGENPFEWIEEYKVGVHQHVDLTKWASRATTRVSYPTWTNIIKFGA